MSRTIRDWDLGLSHSRRSSVKAAVDALKEVCDELEVTDLREVDSNTLHRMILAVCLRFDEADRRDTIPF